MRGSASAEARIRNSSSTGCLSISNSIVHQSSRVPEEREARLEGRGARTAAFVIPPSAGLRGPPQARGASLIDLEIETGVKPLTCSRPGHLVLIWARHHASPNISRVKGV